MRRAAKIDTTARALVDTARALGCRYHHIGGVIDGLLLTRYGVEVVDWKTPKNKRGEFDMTDAQAKLVAEGWPVRFITCERELLALMKVPHYRVKGDV